jgi:hypothetical protein
MGWLIQKGEETILRLARTPASELAAGALLVNEAFID